MATILMNRGKDISTVNFGI